MATSAAPLEGKASAFHVRLKPTPKGVAQDTWVKKAIADLSRRIQRGRLKGYILDLRNDPGGLLDQAVSVSDAFLTHGEIVSLPGRHGEHHGCRCSAPVRDLADDGVEGAADDHHKGDQQ